VAGRLAPEAARQVQEQVLRLDELDDVPAVLRPLRRLTPTG
jgi:hypothetical protein